METVMTAPQDHENDVDEPDLAGIVLGTEASGSCILAEKQRRLLIDPLYSSWPGPPSELGGFDRFVALARVGLVFSIDQPPIVPDVMLSWNATTSKDLCQKNHGSCVMWDFGKPPDVMLEIVSNGVEDELGAKLQRYSTLRVAHYVIYDPLGELEGPVLRTFELRGGLYVAVGHPWFESVGLGLVEWEGAFEGVRRRWLRWRTRDGSVVLTGVERAQVVEQAQKEEARAKRLAARLRELGVDPNGDG